MVLLLLIARIQNLKDIDWLKSLHLFNQYRLAKHYEHIDPNDKNSQYVIKEALGIPRDTVIANMPLNEHGKNAKKTAFYTFKAHVRAGRNLHKILDLIGVDYIFTTKKCKC